MAWTPDGTILALSSLDRVYIVRFFGHDHLDDGSQPVLLATFIELGGQVCSISLSQKGSLLNLYVLLFGSRLLRFPVPTGMVRAVFRATDLNPASMDIFQWNPAVCCMQLLDDTLVVGGATLSNRPCVSVFTLGEAGISATDPVAVHVWSSSKGGDSSSSSSISSLPYAAVCSISLQRGSKAIALLTNGATLSVNTSSHAPGVSMLRLGGSGSITSVEWISEDQVAVADVHKGFVEIIRLPGGRGREEEGDREPERLLRKEFSWPQVTRGHAGRFFILTAVQHRRPIHPVITAEKLREWQKKEDHAQTFWGSLKRSLYSYVEYFHVPQLNLAPSLWEIEQLSSLVQYESLSAAAMVERKVASEEYDEALALAKEHDLPCDEIHKRRWLHQVSLAPQTSKDMEETLGRVNDCVWVLQQCLNFEGRNGVEERSLLQFALSLLSDNSRSGSTLSPILKSAYELMFVDRLHRLESYLELSEFDSKDFFNFVRQDLALAVLVHARHGRVAVVRTLMKRHAGAVLPFRLHILSAFPETTPLTDVKPLLPSVVDGFEKLWTSVPVPRFEEEVLRGLRQAVRRGDVTLGGEDWDEVLKALLFPRESVRIHSTSFTPTASLQLSADEIGAWWSKRVLEVDESSGQLDIALALAKEGLARGVPGLELLLQRLEELNLLVYRFGGASLRLRSYCEASEYQRCAGFLSVLDPSGANLSEVLEVVRLHFAPSVLVQHLRRYGVHCAQSMQTLPISVLLLKRSVPSVPVEQRPFAQVSDLLECALEFAYSCPDAKAHVVWMDVVRVLPTRLTHQGDAVLEGLHDRLDALEADLEACAILERLGLPTSASGLSSGGGDGDGDGEALLGRVMSLAGKRRRTSPAEWNALLRDLLQLRQSVFKRLSSEKIYASYVRTLVAAREFSLVSKVSKECGASFEEAVVSAAWELFDASSALDDAGVEGARQALALVEAAGLDEPPSAERAKLTALCEVARWLAQLGVQMIPLQMKPWAGQTNLDAFARVQEAIRKSRLLPPADLIGSDRAETLATLLGCSGQGRLVLEAIGLSLISHGRAAQVEAQAITLGSCLLARRLVLSGAWSPASLDVLRTMMGLALSGCPSNAEMGRLLDRGRVLEMDFLRQYGDAVSPDPEPVVGALGRDRCAVAENLRRGPLQIVAISDAPSQWTDEILLTAASGSDFDTAMRLFDKCTSVKVPAMWLSSRERTKCLCEYVSKHPGHNLEPLIPADASNDDDDPYARLDVNLVRDPKGSSSVTNNNIPNNNNNNNNNDDAEKEPEDIGQLAKAVWGKLW